MRFIKIYGLPGLFSFVLILFGCSKDPKIEKNYPGWSVYDNTNSGLMYNDVEGIVFDSLGHVWISNLSELIVYDSNSWRHVVAPGGDQCAITFQHGVGFGDFVWVGGCRGLAKINISNYNVTIYDPSNSGIASDVITGIDVERNGSNSALWLTTSGGLCKFDGINWQVYNMSNSPMTAIESHGLTIDRSFRKWFLVKQHPVVTGDTTAYVMFDSQSASWQVHTSLETGFPIYGTYGIISDQSNSIWSGCVGIDYWDGSEWLKYDEGNSPLPNDLIRAISIDSTGTIWFGTDTRGIMTYDHGEWTSLTTSNSGLPCDSILTIECSPTGAVWIGTANGLAVYKPD